MSDQPEGRHIDHEALDRQLLRATQLANLLNEELGTEEVENPCSAGLVLDMLAILGLRLMPDEGGEASMAFIRGAARPRSDKASNN